MSDYTPTTEEVKSAALSYSAIMSEADWDSWLAAHDAEVRAGVAAEEPEWAVSVARTIGHGAPVIYDFPDRLAAERFIKNPPLWFSRDDNQTKTLVHRRKAGPWVPVKQEGADDA